MLFSSVTFLFAFLPAVLALYFLVPGRFRTMRNAVLLVFSLAFYGWGEPRLILLMLASVTVNYVGALLCEVKKPLWRRTFFAAAVVCNLLLLGVFKYADFAVQSLDTLLSLGGLPTLSLPGIALPIGISFYTFQGMGYLVDVYRADVKAERNPAVVALYISLFPQLIAGPIVRYTDVAAAIYDRRENLTDFGAGIYRFAVGFCKKMLLANALAEAADTVFDAFSPLTSLVQPSAASAIIGALAYTGQIYFDFSGYSDMAIGLGRVFGFGFRENFDAPYLASSATEFWRRWHISLSGWFRDYVYIPLGGSRVGTLKNIRNLCVVWLLTGLWHGAAWTFVLWGLWWLAFLLGERYLWRSFTSDASPNFLKKCARHVYLIAAVVFGWILFRSESAAGAVRYVCVMFGSNGFADGQTLYLLKQYKFELAAGTAAVLYPALKTKLAATADSTPYLVITRILVFAAFLYSMVTLISGGYNPFIYFRF